MGAIIGFEAELSGFNKFYYQYFLPILFPKIGAIIYKSDCAPATLNA